MRGVVAGLVVVALAVVCAVVFMGKGEKPVEKVEKEPTKIKEVKPAAAPTFKEEVALPEKSEADKRRELFAKMTPLERFDYAMAELKKKPIDLTPLSNQVFRTGTEQILSWLVHAVPGDMPPPIPNIPIQDEMHLAEILIADNPVKEGDSEAVIEAKKGVEEAKKELRDYLKQGGEAKEFFDYYRGQLIQSHEEWIECQKSVVKVLQEDPTLAEEYVKEVNNRLAEKGIKPVLIPPPLRKKFGLDEE